MGLSEKHIDPIPWKTRATCWWGQNCRLSPQATPPQKQCTREMPAGRSLEKKLHQYLGTFNTHLTLCGALGPHSAPRGVWTLERAELQG